MTATDGRVPGDVVVLPAAPGRWVAYNAFARTALGLDDAALQVLGASDAGDGGRRYAVWRIGRFANAHGLMADPTPYVRDRAEWPEPEHVSYDDLLRVLGEHFLLVADDQAYLGRFAPKTSILDHERFGNFHQQLGQELLLVRRENPDDWWLTQKFTPDLGAVRDNLYGAIQASFLEHYLARRIAPGDAVIDVGCGPGHYTHLIARRGADVLGLDPSERFVELARQRAPSGARFEVAALPEALHDLPAQSADYVFMSDALLFYFVSPSPAERPDPDALLRGIRRVLRPGGRFLSLEPHYLFWLLPWLGDVDRPFTIVTEYLHKTFGVTPSMSELVRTFARGGFAVSWMEELTPRPEHEQIDPRAYRFASAFPLWHLYELTPVAGE